MKKILTVVCMIFVATILFAQSTQNSTPETSTDNRGYDERTILTIVPENQHLRDQTAEVRIEYRPMYDEARFFYTCMYVTYDKGEAMNTVMECIRDFMQDNQYYRYTYAERDRERYFKDERGYNCAQYISYVRFSR